jgi:hypothetical protein
MVAVFATKRVSAIVTELYVVQVQERLKLGELPLWLLPQLLLLLL